MNNKIKELFRRYEAGEANDQECDLVEAWFAKYDKVPVHLDDKDQKALKELDSDIERLLSPTSAEKNKDRRPVKKIFFFRQAAIWAGLLLISALVLWQLKKNTWHEKMAYIEKINANGLPVRYLLPDSSLVYLGSGSKLQYPENFKGAYRDVTLQGVAFFNVKHNASKPFIIHTGEIQTQVLGTSFKVEAFNRKPIIISVATGKVGVTELSSKQNKLLAMLTSGLKVTWDRNTRKVVQGKTDIYSLEQWQAGNMIFEEQALGDVIDELQRRFGIHIVIIDKEVADYKISSTFSPKETAPEVLKILSKVGKFRFVKNDDKSFKIYKTE